MVSGRQIRPALIPWVVLAKRKAGKMGLGGAEGVYCGSPLRRGVMFIYFFCYPVETS